MRLLTLRSPNGPIAAVERDGSRLIVNDAQGRAISDVGNLLRHSDWRNLATRASVAAAPEWRVLRPILEPGATVCVGLNYKRHVLEMGRQLPTVPTLFSKLPRALTDPDTSIPLPADSNMMDYEGELTIVIGQGGRNIPHARAWDAVAGFTLLNDVTARDFQKRSLQWFAGKSWERATPVGPVFVTADEFPDFPDREIVTRVNGEERQRSPMSDLIFDVPTLVSDLSRIITLEPGDMIATGTPGGVGDAMKPPSYLKPGDVVEISFDGIGLLRNTFVRAS
ncbi:MAG: fumarylacetoacetate hydrolase family protein [Candidatus Zixiibacteriota bacterium]